jgi:hypothetical protein
VPYGINEKGGFRGIFKTASAHQILPGSPFKEGAVTWRFRPGAAGRNIRVKSAELDTGLRRYDVKTVNAETILLVDLGSSPPSQVVPVVQAA